MRILEMTASFGKLSGETLRLAQGLNCIYAPNESGKSTWSHFLRVMLYGLSTRERGVLADKNRFAPWNGKPMAGQLLLETESGRRIVLTRETRRAAAPMGEFSCTYEGTSTPVEGIDGQNAGEVLLGVSREVFERSAFIRQSALAVDQDAELERRIAALITSGEEDVSYSESCERLKKQINRRRHNKTGLIPQTEAEIDRLERQLAQTENLTLQAAAAQEQLDTCRRQLSQAQEQCALWQQLDDLEAARRLQDAQRTAAKAQQRERQLRTAGPLPDEGQLSAMEGQATAAAALEEQLCAAQLAAQQARAAAREAEELWRAHCLYPADEAGLRARLDALRPPAPPSKALWLLPAALLVLCGIFVYLLLIVAAKAYIGVILSAVGTIAASLGVWLRFRKHALARDAIVRQQQELSAQLAEYLPLQQAAQSAEAEAVCASAAAAALHQQLCNTSVALMALLGLFCPEVTALDDARQTLQTMREQRTALQAAQQETQEALLRLKLLREHLHGDTLPLPDTVLPAPLVTREEAQAQAAALSTQQQAAQSRLDTLLGQLRGCGETADLQAQLAQRRQQLQTLCGEYDALTLALEVLSEANTQLQNRFSPALGARAAEIFGAITGGRYQKVLLSRDFSIQAEEADGLSPRGIQLLSQGTADQLYLAVRLAVCDMVLPRETPAPLVLDDALLSFDEERLHAALDYLAEEGQRRQILLFSCQRREETYLDGRDVVRLIHLPR